MLSAVNRRGRPPHPDVLTPAEWEIFHMVRHGMTNRRIAIQRGTTVDAVKFHLENIRLKLDVASRAELRQLRRQPGQQWEATMSAPAPASISRIGQVAHTVRDLDAAVTFFRDTLGLQHLFTAGQLAFFDCGGTRLMVDALPEAQGNGNSVLYFQVEDIEAAAAGLQAKGVELQAHPHRIHTHPDGTEEWMAFFADPESNTLAFMAQRRPA